MPPRRAKTACPAVAELREKLHRLGDRYDRRFLESDPIGIVRRYDRSGDREIVGALAAGLAYGRVASIRASLDHLLKILGPRPARFLETYRHATDAARFDGFVHRFTRGRDVALFLWLLRGAIERSGSIESFFVEGDPQPSSPTLEGAMDAFADRLFSGLPRDSGTRWLLPRPANGSVCKRHCLFLRWMVRPDDGIDLGAWTRVSAARLVVPLDVHMQRVARAFGWSRRRSPTWAMAVEVTQALRLLDPTDPTRYDFALSRLGILGLLRSSGDRSGLRRLIEVLDDVSEDHRATDPSR